MNAYISSGSGDPEGSVTGKQGALYLRRDGDGTTTVYQKASGSGNTGWLALPSKAYVDAVAVGLDVKASCRLATAAVLPFGVAVYANGSSGVGATLTGFGFGALTVDGVAAAVGDRILVKDQATHAHNGIYTVSVVGGVATLFVLIRATDFDQAAEIAEGDFTLIEEGTANAHQGWLLTSSGPFTMGTTSLDFTQFSAAGEYTAGTGISISGTTIAVTNLSGDVTTSGSTVTTLAAGSASSLNSGTLAAGRLPALTGDVTSSAGSAATTLAAGSASNLNSGTLSAGRLPAHTGDVTSSAGSAALTIANSAVTYAKMQNISATNLVLGRTSSGAGSTEELSAAHLMALIRYGDPRKPSGAIGETVSRIDSIISSPATPLASGTLFLSPIILLAGTTATTVNYCTGTTTPGTPTNWWFALYTSALALVAQTADQTTTTWPASTLKSLALQSPAPYLVPTSGLYYVGVMINTSNTMQNLIAVANGSGNAIVRAPIVNGASSTGRTTTAPDPAAAIVTSATVPYAYIT